MMISLLYHDVVPSGNHASSGFPDADAAIYKLTPPAFERHLEAIAQGAPEVWLLHSGQQTIPGKALLFTFDDGGVSALPVADRLEAQGWRGHFFITTDYIGRAGFLTIPQIRELHGRGHVVGTHSCSHPARISHCPPAQLDREWRQSAQILSDCLGERVVVGSVPGGFYGRRVAEAAQNAGIDVLFTSEPRSRLQRVRDCLIVGRYLIRQGTSPNTAARIALGDPGPRVRQYLFWTTKKLLKRIGGPAYLSLRKKLLQHRPSHDVSEPR
jgi:peptidoglycan/xylan/chitin deacetylase (PgdA/CDA1 family)